MPAARCRCPRDEMLRRSESLEHPCRHVLAHTDRLREGYLNRTSTGTHPHTRRTRRVREGSLIHTGLARLIVRHAHRYGSHAAPTPTVVGGETDVVDAAVTTVFPFGKHHGGRVPDARCIGTDIAVAHAIERLVLRDAGDSDSSPVAVWVRQAPHRHTHELVVRRPHHGGTRGCRAAIWGR